MDVKMEYRKGCIEGDCFECRRKINCGKFSLIKTLPQITFILRNGPDINSKPARFAIEFECDEFLQEHKK